MKECFAKMKEQPDRKIFTCLRCPDKRQCYSMSIRRLNPEEREQQKKEESRLKEILKRNRKKVI